MHTRRWNRRTGSVLVVVGLFAAGVATAAPAVAGDNRAPTQLALTATPSTSTAGQSVTLKATLSFTRSGNRVPTGLVHYAASNGGNRLVYLGSASVGGCSLVAVHLGQCEQLLVGGTHVLDSLAAMRRLRSDSAWHARQTFGTM